MYLLTTFAVNNIWYINVVYNAHTLNNMKEFVDATNTNFGIEDEKRESCIS